MTELTVRFTGDPWCRRRCTRADSAGCTGGEVRQLEGGRAITAVGRADQREQCGALLQRERRAVAERPVRRCEVEAEDLDFAEKGLRHESVFQAKVRIAKERCRPRRCRTPR